MLSGMKKLKFMVVDDDADVVAIARVNLTYIGHEMDAYMRGDDAISAISNGKPYDAAILDIELSGASGIEVAEVSKFVYPHKPVIIMSGWNYKQYNLIQGADAIFTKPMDFEEAVEWLKINKPALFGDIVANTSVEPQPLIPFALNKKDRIRYQIRQN